MESISCKYHTDAMYPTMRYVLDPMIINGVTDFSGKTKHICKTSVNKKRAFCISTADICGNNTLFCGVTT